MSITVTVHNGHFTVKAHQISVEHRGPFVLLKWSFHLSIYSSSFHLEYTGAYMSS